MDGAKDKSVLYRMKLRGGDDRAAAREGGKQIEDEAGNPPSQLFRFEVRAAGGGDVKFAIAIVDEAALQASDLRWGEAEHQHGAETTMHARISGHDGSPVRFVVEHDHGGTWQHYATVPATVKNGEATASLRVHHPFLPPTGHEPTAEQLGKAKPAQLRFKVEKGAASPQPRAEQQKIPAASKAPQAKAADLEVSDLSWSKKDHQHGAEAKLHARLHGHDGSPVRFVVEHDDGGTWRPYAIVPATVKNGEAAAALHLHHPVLPPGGHAELAQIRKAKPAQLRFKVEKG
jgi:hypothetical protein